jgi:hypothetical protein
LRLIERDSVSSLHDYLDAGAADALNLIGRDFDRHARVETDVARQHVCIEACLRHRARDHCSDVARGGGGLSEHIACGLDAEVDRRHVSERAVVVDERRAHTGDEPGVVEGDADAGFPFLGQGRSSIAMTRADGVRQ